MAKRVPHDKQGFHHIHIALVASDLQGDTVHGMLSSPAIRVFSGFVAVAILMLATPVHAASPCVDADGTTPIIESGREGDIAALFAPYKLGEQLEGVSGITFADLPVDATSLTAVVADGDHRATLKLVALECVPDAKSRSASFAFETGVPPSAPDNLRL